MGQITIYLDDDTERLVKRHVKGSKESASRWIAEAVRKRALAEWPADLLALFGSWKDADFPDAAELRTNLGADEIARLSCLIEGRGIKQFDGGPPSV